LPTSYWTYGQFLMKIPLIELSFFRNTIAGVLVRTPRNSAERKLRTLSLSFLFLIISIFLSYFQPAYAATNVGGAISEDTTWTLAGSPYVVSGGMVVNAGKTLTIDPGVVVKFENNAYLEVLGTLKAVGTAGNPIYFTDKQDDSVGGDTNTRLSQLNWLEGKHSGRFIWVEEATDKHPYNFFHSMFTRQFNCRRVT